MALVSGPTLGSAIADKDNSIRKLVLSVSNDQDLVKELFMRVLSRPASESEIAMSSQVFEQIKQDHVKLIEELDKREGWWKEQKPLREEELKRMNW